jgi:hypothetical protein
VYSCHRRSSAGTCPAPASITLHRLDEHVGRIALRELAHLKATGHRSDRNIEEARAELRNAERELTAYLEAVSAADIGAEAFREGARRRREALDRARASLAGAVARQPGEIDGDPTDFWSQLDAGQRNRLLRGLLEAVVVARAGGPGRVVPVEQRVRVLKHGAGIVTEYAGGGTAHGIRPIDLPDLNSPVVLRP